MSENAPIEAALVVEEPAALAVLYDPIRYRIFRALETPKTIGELAELVGRPANRLYYHVRLLVEHGIVRQVDARARGRHTERVYGRTAERVRFRGELEEGAGRGLLGAIAEELDAAIGGVRDESAPATVCYHVISLTAARAGELEARLRALMDEFEGDVARTPGARRFGLLGALVPLGSGEEGAPDADT